MDETSIGDSKEQDSYLQFDNLPNRLTLFRILLIPVVIGCLMGAKILPDLELRSLLGWVAGWTFTAASITDFFDGYIARKKNIVTVFGSFLDPIADKFLIISSLIMLLHLERVPILVVIILVLREIYITSLRLLAQTEGISVPVDNWGKWKTTFQMIGVGCLMANAPLFFIPLQIIGPIAIYIAAALSAFSAVNYTVGMFKNLKEARKNKKEKNTNKKKQD